MSRIPKVLFMLPLLTEHLRHYIYKELEESSESSLFKQYVQFLLSLSREGENSINIEAKWFERRKLSDRVKKKLRKKTFLYLKAKLERYYSAYEFYYDLIKESNVWKFPLLGALREAEYIKNEINKYTSDDDCVWYRGAPLLRADHFVSEIMAGKWTARGPIRIIKEGLKHLGSVELYLRQSICAVIAGLYTITPIIDYTIMRKQANLVYVVLKFLISANNVRTFHPHVVPLTYLEFVPLFVWYRILKSLNELISKELIFLRIFFEHYTRIRNSKDVNYIQSISSYIRRVLYSIVYATPIVTRELHSEIESVIDIYESAGLLDNAEERYDPQLIHLLIEGSTWLYLVGYREKALKWQEKVLYYLPASKPMYISRIWKQAQLLKAMLYGDWEELRRRNREFLNTPREAPPHPHVTKIIYGVVDLICGYEIDNVDLIERSGERIYRICRRYNIAMDFGRWARYVARNGWRATFRSFWDKARESLIRLYHDNPFLLTIEDFVPLEAWLIKKRTGMPLHQVLRDYSRLTTLNFDYIHNRLTSEFTYPKVIPDNWLDNFDRAIDMIKKQIS